MTEDLRNQLQAHLGDAFVLERELGGGGMSRVFVATESRLARRVAIKVLSPELAQGLNAERFEREILMAASLQQANIVPVLAAGELDGLPYFTMPFVDGESLRNRLTGSGLPIDDVVTILRDVSKALAYAHARGIVHRDIKPDNVLLSGGTAVVTDFGIAKALAESKVGDTMPGATLTQVGTSIGTPPYMAPEQIAGDPNVDHRVDLYALGCMAFEMLAGRTPFGNHPPQKMLAAHLSERPAAVETLRPDCPPTLALLVARLLEKDPADRIADATEVVQALATVGTASSESDVLSPRGRMVRSLVGWAVATLVVWIVAKAAVVGIGLPDWTARGALGVMLLGLPVILATGWAKWMARKASTATPTLTPGGSNMPLAAGTMANIAIKANRHLSFRKAQRGGMYAMSAFVLLIVAFMVTRSLGVGPAASLFATGSLAADDRIVLADFTAASEDSTLAPIVQAAVREAMGQSRAVQLLDATTVAAELERMERPGAALDAATARDLAVRTGAKAILGGRLARAGSGFAVSLDLVATEGGANLASFQGTADGPSDLLTVVDDLTRKLRSKMGESLKQVAQSIPLERATTSNLEALRLYTEATYANDVESEHEKAVTLLRQAVALDSTFALAWRKLYAALLNARLPQVAQDSALERAAKYADKLPERERLMVMGALYQGHSRQYDPIKAMEAYRRLFVVDPNNQVATNQLAQLHSARQANDSALYYYRLQSTAMPTSPNRLVVASALISVGDVDGARALYDSIRVEDSLYATQQAGLFPAEIALAAGDRAGARAVAEVMLTSSDARNRLIASNITTAIARTAGQLAASERLERERVAFQGTRGVQQVAFSEIENDVYFRGRPTEAIAKLDRVLASAAWAAIPTVQRPYYQVASLYADAGAPVQARRLMDQVRQVYPERITTPGGERYVADIDAWTLLAEGEPTKALTRARDALQARDGTPAPCTACMANLMAAVFDSLGQADSTIAWLERFLAVPLSERMNPDSWALATTQKRLGELYDAKGERAKAITHYQAFVDQWKDADPELQPVVSTIRKRLAELKTQEGK